MQVPIFQLLINTISITTHVPVMFYDEPQKRTFIIIMENILSYLNKIVFNYTYYIKMHMTIK